MGLREKGYWLRQTIAIRRQTIAMIAQGVNLGMADKEGGERGMDELELVDTAEESRKKKSESIWNIMKVFGGGGRSV